MRTRMSHEVPPAPYDLAEFSPDCYEPDEFTTIIALFKQFEEEFDGLGVTREALEHYNIACPRQLARDVQRRRQ